MVAPDGGCLRASRGPQVIEGLLTVAALAMALVAARITLARRGVFLLGRHGHRMAPSVLLSVWLAGLLTGQVTRSLVGMTFTAALPLGAMAWASVRWFRPLRGRHPRWSRVDWAAFALIAVTVFFLDVWDFDGHRTIVAAYLRGNVPPTAFNDPRFALAYHPVYDAMVAVVLTALPVEFELGIAIVTIACVAFTLSNLQAVSRHLFRSSAVAQLGRLLFLFGFGPVFIRYFLEGGDLESIHGRTSQVFFDIIFRRPTGLGFAFFTLALAFLLPHYRRNTDPAPAPRWTSLAFFLPACAVIPQISEESLLPIGIVVMPLILTRRLPMSFVAVAAAALALGASQSGVVQGVLGHGSMATPHFHLSWPPTLPSWSHEQDGMTLASRDGLLFFALELGPIFFAGIALALFSGDARRRILVAAFFGTLLIVSFSRLEGWPKADLDRFLFYGTPPVFMLSAALIERLWRPRAAETTGNLEPSQNDGRVARLRGVGLSVGVVLFACVAPTTFPISKALNQLNLTFQRHALGGELRRTLHAVGPREPILTDRARANTLAQSGFIVIAPMTSNNVGRVTDDHFDEYVRANAHLARWLFLPETDDRVKGRPVTAQDGGYVLVPANDATSLLASQPGP